MKNSLRKIYLSKRNKLTSEFINLCSSKMLSVYKNSFLNKSNIFMSYMPIKNEAPVNLINNYLKNNGKIVSVPITNFDYTLSSILFNGFSNTVLGKYNVPEPKDKTPLDPDLIEVVLIPGLVFDKTGNRIGYGKGCYDSFLANGTFVKVGVCYEFQIIDGITMAEEHDVTMDYLLTEKALYEI